MVTIFAGVDRTRTSAPVVGVRNAKKKKNHNTIIRVETYTIKYDKISDNAQSLCVRILR